MILVRRIVGESMLPLLRPGQLVFAVKTKKLKPDDVIILNHNGKEKIKRIARLDADRMFVVGDNAAESTDSRSFGWLPLRMYMAKVLWPRAQRGRTIRLE